ncbi:MAG: PHP domain-containing protein [Candidatus Thorarchaeota archaeon]|nr:PHP domain-containing protein [Candidatus Thorarchaeota archaeon]
MVRALADLHIHSNHSDGIYSPKQLVDMAIDLGLGGIALTDHDTIGGNSEFLIEGDKNDLACIPGVEISTEYRGYELHLLGYYVPSDRPELQDRLTAFRDERNTRFPKMVQKLRDLGFDVADSEVEEIMRTAASPGRPHLARILVEMGVVMNIDEAFAMYLAEGKPAYVKRARPDITEGIRILREVGAVPVLAHPLYYSGSDLRSLLIDLKESGLLGVEVVYNYERNSIPEEDTKQVKNAAKGLGLIETGGTDFHGDNTHNELGSMTVSIEAIAQLSRAASLLRNL